MIQQLQPNMEEHPLAGLISNFSNSYVNSRQKTQDNQRQDLLQDKKDVREDSRFQSELGLKKEDLALRKNAQQRDILLQKQEQESSFIRAMTANAKTPEEAASLINLSEQYKSIRTPEKRLAYTMVAHNKNMVNLDSLITKAASKNGVTGLSKADRKDLTNNIKNLTKSGVDESQVTKRLMESGLSEYDVEQAMTPEKASNLLSNLKTIQSGATPQFRMSKKQEANSKNNIAIVNNAIKDGGSINLIYTKLRRKGYSDSEAQQIISDSSKEASLTARQKSQLFNMQQQRQGTLAQILGR